MTVYGVFETPVHMYRGTTMAGIVRKQQNRALPELIGSGVVL